MMRRSVLVVVLLAARFGPFSTALPAAAAAPQPNWQKSITAADRKRLVKLWDAWTRALDEANVAGQGAAVMALGPVAAPDAESMNRDPNDRMSKPLPGALPGAGVYRCRTVKLGQREAARPVEAMVKSDDFAPCRIEQRGATLWFEQDASAERRQRLAGRLYPDGDHMVFLGTTALAGEMGVMAYAADPARDSVGVLRAIGNTHWRLELPWPNWQSNLAIIEIMPA